jgi:putative protease
MKVTKRRVDMTEKQVGRVTHYFNKIGVAIVELEDDLKVGDTIRFKGSTTEFEQMVDSLQIEHEQVQEAKKGQAVGLKVKEHAREHDLVYKVVE